jgi:hypothetical protein
MKSCSSRAQDLQSIGNDMSGNYALGRDIDATGYAFSRLGYASTTPFFDSFRQPSQTNGQ